MKVESLTLENYRGARQVDLHFCAPLTLLVGLNGAGKSSILDAVALMLSWAVARIRRPNGSGHEIANPLDIHNAGSYARLTLTIDEGGEYAWTMVRSRAGRREPDLKSDYSQLTELARQVRARIENTRERCNIPLFVYYPIHRAVLDIPLRIRKQHTFDLLDAFDGSLTSGADFRAFFEWFRNREDLENENRKYRNQLFTPEGFEFPDRQLDAVRRALTRFLPDYTDFSVRRNPLRMVVMKQGEELRIDQLSDGEKCLMAMVGDLARRLAIANPERPDPLVGEGVVLVDEIDLHLHPAWQRMAPHRLTEVFPGCQFILSTHSPQVIGEVAPEAIRRLHSVKERGIAVTVPNQTFGLTSNDILDEVMLPEGGLSTLTRNPRIEERLHKLFVLIDEEDFPQARLMIGELSTELKGDTPDLIRAAALIHMLEDSDSAP